jgi:L-ascorbate metabolism protein UlaG (beta-lactamase superfamily)
MEDLPHIDAVLITHNHFDHLDLPTLRQLGTRGRSTFVVAARCARLLRSQGIESVHELDWGGSPVKKTRLSGYSITYRVRAHEILGAKNRIAIHHGTFQLADDGIDTPQKRLLVLQAGRFVSDS